MQGKLKRNTRTEKNRNFWASVEEAVAQFKELPQWQRDELNRKWDEIHEEYSNRVPTCHHCGQETRGRCYPCYGG